MPITVQCLLSPIFHCLLDRPKAIAGMPPQHCLGIAACAKDEGRCLVGWIGRHLWAGIEHFCICGNGSTDSTREGLASHSQRGVVTYRYWIRKKAAGGNAASPNVLRRGCPPQMLRKVACADWRRRVYRAFGKGQEATWLGKGGASSLGGASNAPQSA